MSVPRAGWLGFRAGETSPRSSSTCARRTAPATLQPRPDLDGRRRDHPARHRPRAAGPREVSRAPRSHGGRHALRAGEARTERGGDPGAAYHGAGRSASAAGLGALEGDAHGDGPQGAGQEAVAPRGVTGYGCTTFAMVADELRDSCMMRSRAPLVVASKTKTEIPSTNIETSLGNSRRTLSTKSRARASLSKTTRYVGTL